MYAGSRNLKAEARVRVKPEEQKETRLARSLLQHYRPRRIFFSASRNGMGPAAPIPLPYLLPLQIQLTH